MPPGFNFLPPWRLGKHIPVVRGWQLHNKAVVSSATQSFTFRLIHFQHHSYICKASSPVPIHFPLHMSLYFPSDWYFRVNLFDFWLSPFPPTTPFTLVNSPKGDPVHGEILRTASIVWECGSGGESGFVTHTCWCRLQCACRKLTTMSTSWGCFTTSYSFLVSIYHA
jgi:hypothetical protein